MTRFLGCGAFGEVYEGIVKGFGAEAETSVAIKVRPLNDPVERSLYLIGYLADPS